MASLAVVEADARLDWLKARQKVNVMEEKVAEVGKWGRKMPAGYFHLIPETEEEEGSADHGHRRGGRVVRRS